jgi:hypothetical protein
MKNVNLMQCEAFPKIEKKIKNRAVKICVFIFLKQSSPYLIDNANAGPFPYPSIKYPMACVSL